MWFLSVVGLYVGGGGCVGGVSKDFCRIFIRLSGVDIRGLAGVVSIGVGYPACDGVVIS